MERAEADRRDLAVVGALLRAAAPGDRREERGSITGRVRLAAAVEQMGRRRPAARVALWAGSFAAAAAVIVAVVFGWARLHDASLTYAIEGGAAGAQGYVSIAPGAQSATLRFSDGSEVALAAGSRGRVARTTADGGEVVLEGGRADVRVVHRAATRWTIDAGPYAVRVTGTAFSVAWSAEKGALDVWMREGRVVIAGPAAPEGVALVAGQHLHAELAAGSIAIDGATAAPEAEAAPEPTPAPARPTQVAPMPLPTVTVSALPPSAPPESTAPPSPSWSKLVGAGSYDAVLEAARAQGEAAALGARSLADVRALGDAARYRGQAALASKAYTAIRARFAGSGEARTAAFLLGRLSEEQLRSPGAALRWYDTYLAEAPSGPFAGDALGRKMVLTSRGSGALAARSLAEEYLRRFPSGAYASAARDLVK